MNYIYIHGFNSGPGNRSGNELEKLIKEPVLRILCDYSQPFASCLENIENQIIARFSARADLCVMGTSLGGFYALQLRIAGLEKIAAWNPVIFPSLQLKDFVGENTRFTDGQKWFFSEEALLSYAAAADPRQWHNFYMEEKYGGRPIPPLPLRHIYIGCRDEVLNPQVGINYWRNHALLEIIDSAHGIEDFSTSLPFLKCSTH